MPDAAGESQKCSNLTDPTLRWCHNPACRRRKRGGFTKPDPALFALPRLQAAVSVAVVWAGAVLAEHAWTRWGAVHVICAVLGVGLSVWQQRGEEATVRSIYGKQSDCGVCGHTECLECRWPWHPGLPCGFQEREGKLVDSRSQSNLAEGRGAMLAVQDGHREDSLFQPYAGQSHAVRAVQQGVLLALW